MTEDTTEEAEEEGGRRAKNKRPTQSCGEKEEVTCICNIIMYSTHSVYL